MVILPLGYYLRWNLIMFLKIIKSNSYQIELTFINKSDTNEYFTTIISGIWTIVP